MSASDDELMREAKEFEKNLLNFFLRQGVSYTECQDYVQETYLRLWNYRDRYRPAAKLTTFLFILARQVRLDALRRQIRREGREKCWGGEQSETAAPAEMCVREEVRWALAQLSEPLREVIELAVFQDLPYAEVAEILSIPPGTVKSRMFNALKRLKEVFDDKRS